MLAKSYMSYMCLWMKPIWEPQMGVDVFLGSVAAAGMGSAGSSNLLCSQGLVKSSIAAAVSAKDKVTTAQ